MTSPTELRYRALGFTDVRAVMQQTNWGFKDVYDYLATSKRYMQREDNHPKAAIVAVDATGSGGSEPSADPVWVTLEPSDIGDDANMERLFEEFFAEHTNEVTDVDRANLRSHGTITVLDRDADDGRLLLRKHPRGDTLRIRPNTYVIWRQMQALQLLQDRPRAEHAPLLKLVQEPSRVDWPDVPLSGEPDWAILTDTSRAGTEDQRRFVRKALATPDFAVLEGPPGSGKTTTICELVIQLVRAGNRVLMCSSTHAAVDNLLERLDAASDSYARDVLAVRVDTAYRCARSVRHLRIEEFAREHQRRIAAHLRNQDSPTRAQEELLALVSADGDLFERFVLDCANVVCGTTIGILQHPDIKSSSPENARMFDYLVLDEASKTSFSEFLVPAALAKRWVLVGDPRQLSPYTDDAEIRALLVRAAGADVHYASARLDLLELLHRSTRHLAVVDPPADARQSYESAASHVGLPIVRSPNPMDPGIAFVPERPTDHDFVRTFPVDPQVIDRWAEEVAWRLSTQFQLRMSSDPKLTSRLQRELEVLLAPTDDHDDPVIKAADLIERIALPSALEAIQLGTGRTGIANRRPTVLTDGMAPRAFAQRHELLRYQYRMHPDIAAFARERVYAGEALHDDPQLERSRDWEYDRYTNRVLWIDVPRRDTERTDSPEETAVVTRELEDLAGWATVRGGTYEVAILSFYRNQVRSLRTALKKLCGTPNANQSFQLGPLDININTIDGFQGREADIVFLSIGKGRTTYFTRSLNRVNVALTRARFQLVIVGDHSGVARNPRGLLAELAQRAPVDHRWARS